ncbi:hypothetical protein SOVF_202230, partial [Spinacia oleracea]
MSSSSTILDAWLPILRRRGSFYFMDSAFALRSLLKVWKTEKMAGSPTVVFRCCNGGVCGGNRVLTVLAAIVEGWVGYKGAWGVRSYR